MKTLAALLLLFAPFAAATEQESDVILFHGDRCELETHWLFPSPLQAYFAADKKREYPFESQSTANWRGHIATYEITQDRLYLVKINPSSFASLGEKPDAAKAKEKKTQLKTQLHEIFADRVGVDGKIPVTWYSGNLRVFSKPEKKQKQHQDDKTPREVVEFTEIALLQIKDGTVIKETSFPRSEYWEKFEIMQRHRQIAPKEAAAIEDHLQFLDQSSRDWENSGSIEPKGPLRTEADFSVFLTRQLDHQVRIPLTEYTLIKDTTIDFAETSWISDSDLRIKPGANLLLLEMGSTNVPRGEWSAYTGGAVQVLVQLGKLASKRLTFTASNREMVKQINNYGGSSDDNESLQGSLQMELSATGKVLLTGSIRLTTKNPTTFQEIELKKNEVPYLTIRDYLKTQMNPMDDTPVNAEKVYQEILEKSKAKP